MKILLIFLLSLNLLTSTAKALYTEFYINPNAAAGCTNVNAGSTATGTATYTSTATVAGGWNGAAVFTPDDGTTPASTVSVGMFASIFTNGVNTNAIYIGLITNVAAGVNGAISVSGLAKVGTLPALCLGANAAITIKVGGTWKGPYTNAAGGTSVTFPFSFVGPSLTNASAHMTCVNIIGGTNYNVTNAITHSINGPMRWEGYTNVAHDGGLAVIHGGQVVAGYTLFTASCTRNDFVGLIFDSNGGSGSANGVSVSSSGNFFKRCSFRNMRVSGVISSALGLFVECEAATNNLNNSASAAGFNNQTATQVFIRCIARDNTNANTSGFFSTQSITLIDCIATRNGLHGITHSSTGDPVIILNTDAYRNGSSGLAFIGTAPNPSVLRYIENCNFVTNGAFGINMTTVATNSQHGELVNNGFGSGNRTNASGSLSSSLTLTNLNPVTYASGVTPWVAPDSDNFQINLGTAYSAGRGLFFDTSGLTGSIGYPSIGAVQPPGFTNATSAATSQ